MTELRNVYILDEDGNKVGVQYPFSVDGDRAYEKDISVANSSSVGWTGAIVDLFNSYTDSAKLYDSSATNPKTFTIHFEGPMTANALGLASATGGNFSNVKVELQSSTGNVRNQVDESSDNTKYTDRLFQFTKTSFIKAVITFSTADPVSLNACLVQKIQSRAISSIDGYVSETNSTLTPLLAGATFTGGQVDTLNYGIAQLSIHSDVVSADFGLKFQFRSTPNSTWFDGNTYTYESAGTDKPYSEQMARRFMRVLYTNGGTNQTTFDLQTSLKPVYVKPSSHEVGKTISNQDDAELVKAVNTGFDQDDVPQNIRATEVGATLTADFLVEVARGNIPGYELVHKFGAGTLSTTPAPVTLSGVYQTPTANTALEFVSDDVNDTAAGTGAQEITITGLVESGGIWSELTQTIETNGTTPVPIGTDQIRMYRWFVSRSGTYASSTAGSHAGNLTIRVAGAGATWSVITNTPLPFSQSQIGSYTVPSGKTAYMFSKSIFIDTTKTADVYFFQRPNANDVVAPYSGTRRLVEREVGIQGGFEATFRGPKGKFIGPCDLGFIGVVSVGTSDISVEFVLLVIDD